MVTAKRLCVFSCIAAVAASVASAQEPPRGLSGAGLCVASADFLTTHDREDRRAQHAELAATWRDIMTAISADADARESAIAGARGRIDGAETRRPGMGVVIADSFLNAGACVGRENQVRYLARFGSPELMDAANQRAE